MRIWAAIGIALAAIPAHGDWYKGVTHIHSLWSDGDAPPETIAKWYKDRGYHFISFSEHNRFQEGEKWVRIGDGSALRPEHVDAIRAGFGEDWVVTRPGRVPEMKLKTHEELLAQLGEPGAFLMIPAEEVTSIWSKVHTNAINIRETIPSGEGEQAEVLQQHIDAVAYQRETYAIPMIAHLNHMNWNEGVTSEVVLQTDGLRFFEVYNGHPGTHPWGRAGDGMPSMDEHWDIMQAMRLRRDPDTPLLYGVATDDSHEYHEWGLGKVNPGRGWVMVQADALTAQAILSAMETGDFYSTTGVLLDAIEKTEDALRVTVRDKPGVSHRVEFIGTREGFDTSSEAKLGPDDRPLPRATRAYSEEVGEVLFETAENPAVYHFAGDELYVRARVISDRLQDNPVAEGDREMAWVQPIRP